MLMNNSASAAWCGDSCTTIVANIGDVLFAAQLASEHPDHCFPTIRDICTLITDGYAYMSAFAKGIQSGIYRNSGLSDLSSNI